MTDDTAAIRVEDLGKTYRPFPRILRLFVRNQVVEPVRALDGVSFDVAPGEICAVVGPNGAGKTTLFRVLAGLTTPDVGRAQVLGTDVTSGRREVRAHLGWMSSDERSLFLRHTCTENLRFHGRLQGMEPDVLRIEIPRLLAVVGLEGVGPRSAFALSRGQRARLQLARALLPRPDVLVLDEPTGAIDPIAAAELLDLVRDLVAARGVATLISSHRLEEIEALGARVLLLDRGRCVFDGSLARLRSTYDTMAVVLSFASVEAARRAHAGLGTWFHSSWTPGSTDLHVVAGPHHRLGEVLRALGGDLDALVEIRRTQLPLRDLLARVYEQPDVAVGT